MFKLHGCHIINAGTGMRMGLLCGLLSIICCAALTIANAQETGQPSLQKTLVNIDIRNSTLDKAFDQIEQSTVFRFVYNPTEVRSLGLFTFRKQQVSIEDALRQLLPERMQYERKGYNLLITHNTSYKDSSRQQPYRLARGRITDEKGNPLEQVSVVVHNSNRGTVSNAQGEFSVPVTEQTDSLGFSMIGYLDQTIASDSQSYILVRLKPDPGNVLEDIVVLGYGTAHKKDLTTSIVTISGDRIIERPSTLTLVQGMAGKVPGVNIMINSGKPGGNAAIRIRGIGSINASNAPLYVVDGVVGVDPSTIEPTIVESVDILKDASASAIYGTRGANGVIVVTTKKGRKSNPAISYKSTISLGFLSRKVDILGAEASLEVFRQAYEYVPGRIAPHLDTANHFLRKNELFYPDGMPKYHTDWQEEATRTAVSHDHTLTFSKAGDQFTGLTNISYKSRNGIVKNSYNRQLSVFANTGWQVSDWFHLQTILHGIGSEQNSVEGNVLGWNPLRTMLEFLPFLPVKYRDGTYSRRGDYPGAEESENAIRLLEEMKNIYGRGSILANVIGTMHFSGKLDFTTNLSGQAYSSYNYYYAGKNLRGISETQEGIATRSHANGIGWTLENYFTWKNRFRLHSLTATAGAGWYFTANSSTGTGSEGFYDDFFQYNSLQTGTVVQRPVSNQSDSRLNSYYTRLNYSYDDKYLLDVSFRADGSSRFSNHNRFGFFPAFSGAWRISREPFMLSANWARNISDLKARISYGIVGNAEIGNYVIFDALNNAQAVFNNQVQPAVTLASIGNKDLKWEKAHQLNIGIDLSLFNGRFVFSGDVYNKVNKDLLYYKLLPATTGYVGFFDNIGSIRNRGLELSLQVNNILAGPLQWDLSLNYSMNRSRVLKLNNDIIYTWGGRIKEGRPLNEFYGYLRLGTWGLDEAAAAAAYNKKPGDLKYADLNHNGQKDAEDRTELGNAMPKWESNMINRLAYRSWSLTADVQVMYGHKIANFTRQLMENRVTFANSYSSVEQAWTPQSQETYVASLRLPGDGYENEVDSRSVEDGSFLRLRTVSVMYRFNRNLLGKGISNFTVGLNIENLFLVTGYKGYDPEVTSFDAVLNQGVDFYQYPKPRTFSLIINVDF